MTDIRLRRATAQDMETLSGTTPTPLYVRWDGAGEALPFWYIHTYLFESGRRIFLLDDNGAVVIFDAEGNSVLGNTELYVERERLYMVLIRCKTEWRVAETSYPAAKPLSQAGDHLRRLTASHPTNEYCIAELLI